MIASCSATRCSYTQSWKRLPKSNIYQRRLVRRDTNEKHFGPKEFMKKVTMRDIPQFQRGGSILITKERARRTTKAQRNDPITISIAPDEKGEARGAYYNDDGISFAHASPSGRNRKKLWVSLRPRDEHI